MPRRIALSVFAIAIVMPAQAADLPARSRIGAIFAEPEGNARTADRRDEGPFIYAPQVDAPPLVTGYYGKLNSYYYKSYYGSGYASWGLRLPYACGFYGYC